MINWVWPFPQRLICYFKDHKWSEEVIKCDWSGVLDRYCLRCYLYHRYAKHQVPVAKLA